MTTYITIETNDTLDVYPTNTVEECAAAEVAVREAGMTEAVVHSGDPEGDNVATERRVWPATDAEAAAYAVHESAGVSLYDAAIVLSRLGCSEDDMAAIADGEAEVACWDDSAVADKAAGHTGWFVWYSESDTAVSVTNGDPCHHESIPDLEHARWAARGLVEVRDDSGSSDTVDAILDGDEVDTLEVARVWISAGDCEPECGPDGEIQTIAYGVTVEYWHGRRVSPVISCDPEEPGCDHEEGHGASESHGQA